MKRKALLVGLAVCLLVLPLVAGCSSVDEVDEFDVFKVELIGRFGADFSVEYPKGWSVEIITNKQDDVRVVFNGPLGNGLGEEGELFVGYETGLPYKEWFDIYNHPQTTTRLQTYETPRTPGLTISPQYDLVSARLAKEVDTETLNTVFCWEEAVKAVDTWIKEHKLAQPATKGTPELISGIPCHIFTCVAEGQDTKVYLCDKQDYTLEVFRSFRAGILTQQQIDKLDEYALHMIFTASLE